MTDIDDLVSLERGEVDRRIFSDPDIFELDCDVVAEAVAAGRKMRVFGNRGSGPTRSTSQPSPSGVSGRSGRPLRRSS